MLDGIRANSQSLGVKLAFGIIIVVFVFWGIGSYSGPKGIVASVDGKNITEMEFQRAMGQMEENVRRSLPNVTSEMMDKLNLEQRVLQSLIQEKLMENEAERTHLTVSPYELRAILQQLPYFQKDGKFDPDLYREVLSSHRMTPQQFEADQKKTLIPAKLQRVSTAGTMVRQEDVRALFDYIAERRAVEYVLFPLDKYKANSAPSEEELAKAYEEQKDSFSVPPMVDVEFVKLDPAAMGDAGAVTDADLHKAYDARIAKYTEPEKVHARHLLIRVPASASEADVKKAEAKVKDLEARIRGGEDFAEVAKANGQDGTASAGGDLGWFSAEQMVPEFSKAAFALKDGELSGPVRTQFGFHLIKREEYAPSKVRPFEEVENDLRKELATTSASKGLEEKADAVLAQALAGKSMEEAATHAKSDAVKAERLEGLTVEAVAEKLGVRDVEAQNVMGTPEGTVMDVAVPAGASLLVVKVVKSSPQSVRSLQEVRNDLVEALTVKKAVDCAVNEARKARSSFVSSKPGADFNIQKTEKFDRGGEVPGLQVDKAMSKAAFAQEKITDEWMSEPFKTDQGAVLVRLCEISAPSEEEWVQIKDTMTSRLLNDRAGMAFRFYMEKMGADASMKTFNSPYLNRKKQD